MNRILENLYVGEELEIRTRREVLIQEEIMFPIDVRVHFDKDQMPYPSVWDFAWGVLSLMDRGKVFLYCQSGIDRSPFIATIVVKLYRGTTWEEAWDIVSKGRPQAFHHDDLERMVDKF